MSFGNRKRKAAAGQPHVYEAHQKVRGNSGQSKDKS